jgi:hypothetical protein
MPPLRLPLRQKELLGGKGIDNKATKHKPQPWIQRLRSLSQDAFFVYFRREQWDTERGFLELIAREWVAVGVEEWNKKVNRCCVLARNDFILDLLNHKLKLSTRRNDKDSFFMQKL